jgi:hypothetical protein
MAIEVIGPVITIFRLVIDGIRALLARGEIQEERRIKRWLVELQMRLENLIDESECLVSTICNLPPHDRLQMGDIENVRACLRRVGGLTAAFLNDIPHGQSIAEREIHTDEQADYYYYERFRSPVEDLVLRLLTPETRRAIWKLTHQRSTLIRGLFRYFTDLQFNESTGELRVFLLENPWEHESLVNKEKGLLFYIHRHGGHPRGRWVPLQSAIERYEHVIAGLRTASHEMSQLIRQHVNLQDIVYFRKRPGDD